ncbi:MAG: hypothetical protein KGJ45_11445 [Elusimicrobia bacterium]|nr:hypothetical protein [Elusimicrobiota bacterium]
MPDEENAENQPQSLGGDATVIEAGATDASSETQIDESVNVTVVAPTPPEPEPVVAEPPAETHCPHCEEHQQRISALETQLAAFEQEIQEVEVEVEGGLAAGAPEAPAEPVTETPAEEEMPPNRHVGFGRFWYGRLGERDEA